MRDLGDTRTPLEQLEEDRKIPVEVATANGVINAGSNLGFEYRRNGHLQYIKLRIDEGFGEKTFRRDRKGAESCLWGIDTLNDASFRGIVVITEGEIDRLSVLAAGVGPCVSVPDGAQLAEEGQGEIIPAEDKPFSWLWDGDKLVSGLSRAHRVILATDNDDKGRVLRNELAVRIGRNRCFFVRFPEGRKDANDVLRKDGPEALQKILEAAEPMVPTTLARPSAFDGYSKPQSLELDLGTFSKHMKVSFPSLMAVTGPPNHGKSQATLFLAAMAAWKHGMNVAVLGFEDHPRRIIGDLISFTWRQAAGRWTTDDCRDWVEDHFRLIAPDELDDASFDLAWLTRTIENAAIREGCKIVIVDPWNEVEHLWGRTENVSTYQNRALRAMKALARRFDILLIIVAHPDKASGRETNIDAWNLYAIEGGNAFNNKVDQGLVILRDESKEAAEDEVFWKVCKSRDIDRWGERGYVKMKFDRRSKTYKCVEGEIN